MALLKLKNFVVKSLRMILPRNYCLYVLLAICSSVVITGCKNDVTVLEKQVMTAHDSTMTYMDTIMDIKRNFTNLLKSNGTPDSVKQLLILSINGLQKSKNDMMDWMNQYHAPDKNTDKGQAKKYLDDELKKIRMVHVEIVNN